MTARELQCDELLPTRHLFTGAGTEEARHADRNLRANGWPGELHMVHPAIALPGHFFATSFSSSNTVFTIPTDAFTSR